MTDRVAIEANGVRPDEQRFKETNGLSAAPTYRSTRSLRSSRSGATDKRSGGARTHRGLSSRRSSRRVHHAAWDWGRRPCPTPSSCAIAQSSTPSAWCTRRL